MAEPLDKMAEPMTCAGLRFSGSAHDMKDSYLVVIHFSKSNLFLLTKFVCLYSLYNRSDWPSVAPSSAGRN